MSAKKSPPATPDLGTMARENPNLFFGFEECGVILGFSAKAMGRLSAAGAPVLFRKMNPALVCRWIAANPEKIEKMGDPGDES